MTPELSQTYRLRNGTIGYVDELLNDGTYYGVVTSPGTDLKVRVIWDKEGRSTKRGEAWDLTDAVEPSADPLIEYDHGPRREIDPMARLATAMERIAAVLEKVYEQ